MSPETRHHFETAPLESAFALAYMMLKQRGVVRGAAQQCDHAIAEVREAGSFEFGFEF